MSELRIGLIGLKFGQWYVRTLAAMNGVRLTAVADHSPSVPGGLDGYAARWAVATYRDGLEMIAKESLDAVIVCISPRHRRSILEQAARKGVALLIEKPWAANIAQANELAEVCRAAGARVMTAFSFRFHPAIVRLRALLDGPLGTPHMLNGEYVFEWLPPADNWLWDPEVGGGFLNENSCHLFDAVNFLLGTPLSVMAEAAAFGGTPSASAAALTLRYANGAMAALTIGGVGVGAFHDYPRIDLITATGGAQLRGRDHIWERVTWSTRGNSETQSLLSPPEVWGRTRYTDALEHFFDCLRTGREFSVGVQDGITSVAMAAAVYESARTGRKVLLP